MNLPEDNKNTIVFWNTANYNEIYSSVIYMDAFPLWYNQKKKKGKRFCLRVEAVGWYTYLIFIFVLVNLNKH